MPESEVGLLHICHDSTVRLADGDGKEWLLMVVQKAVGRERAV